MFGELGTAGTVEVYCEKAAAVERNGAALREGAEYRYDTLAKRLTVPFEGATTIVIRQASSLFGVVPAGS
jgi:hypothetical protein